MGDLRSDEKKFAPKVEEKKEVNVKVNCFKCNRGLIGANCWDENRVIETVYYCPWCRDYTKISVK